MSYRIAVGHDVALGGMTILDPQPRSIGVQFTRRIHAANGVVLDQGAYVELIDDIIHLASEYETRLSLFGLLAATTADVTVFCPDQRQGFRRYNGIAVLPEVGRDQARRNYFMQNVTWLIKELTPAS